MLASAHTFTLLGISAHEVHVEVDVRRGLAAFSLVGLPDAAVREARERVRAALENSGFTFPLQRITAGLAPADLRKEGPGLDLAIAAALLAASGQLEGSELRRCALAGELALDGSIRPVPGVLVMAEEARRRGVEAIAVAAANAPEAALAAGPRVVPLERLDQLRLLGTDGEPAQPPPAAIASNGTPSDSGPDLEDLRGQPYLRRALEVAAAGGHGLLMTGPPGAGKSLAARRLPSLLPPLSPQEALEVMRVASVCGRAVPPDGLTQRPFRAPHHTISVAGLVGGGNPPRPGEITLAHRGVLFLDELGEFSRSALEALRQPLEEGRILLARVRHSIELPARFMVVAASNACPCGRGDPARGCRCSPNAVRRYQGKLSGPLADRIDISLAIEQPSAESMSGAGGESSSVVRRRILAARRRQAKRLGDRRCNADMTPEESRAHAALDRDAKSVLAEGHSRLGLSGRGYVRALKVARTIADLAGADRVEADHIGEALTLRRRAQREE